MNLIKLSRVPQMGSPFGAPFDFNVDLNPIGPLNLPDIAIPPAGNGGAPAPEGDAGAGPADPDAADALPPQMRPFYAYPAQEQPQQPATPAAPPGEGMSTTTAVMIGAGALVAVAAIVALASRK